MTLKVRILWPTIGRARPKPIFLSVVPAAEPIPLLAQVWGSAPSPTAVAVPEPLRALASASLPEPELILVEEQEPIAVPSFMQAPPSLPVADPPPVPLLVFEPASTPTPAPSPISMPSFSTFIDQENLKAADESKEISVRKVPPPAKNPLRILGPGILAKAFSWLRKNYSPSSKKALRISETVNLGDKRFVAIIHADGHKFLIGGGSSGVSLLTQLGKQSEAVDPHLSIHELTERSA